MTNIIKKFISNYKEITNYYNYLVNKTKKDEYVEINNEWLLDNYYLLAELYKEILRNKKDLTKCQKIINNNCYFLKLICNKKNYDINFNYLTTELNKYQQETNKTFTYKELSTVIPTIIIIYFDRLNELCKVEYSKLTDIEDINKIIATNNNPSLKDFLENINLEENKHYIYELNNNLYKINNSNKLFKELNEYLKENNIILKDLINEEIADEVKNNVLITNIFNDLKELIKYNTTDLFEEVSKTEEKLLTDKTYKKMTESSKDLYRRRLVKLAHRHHKTEYDYLDEIFDEDTHIGNILFKNKSNTPSTIIYLLTVTLITIIITLYLSKYFIKLRILSFIILFIPISEIVIQIVNHIILKHKNINFIPKIDYSKGIKKQVSTMVVIPTIISTKEKIDRMFNKLETYYLLNKTDNLYFTLLGDAKEEDEQVTDYDDVVTKYGIKVAKRLNEKYKKEIFFFVYRKRVWTPTEEKYMGYERKRGAIIQFNKILLGEGVNEEEYFNANTLHNKDLSIKYVITLDEDTSLTLNSAEKLVGAISHPLNRPVLNKEETKVVKGYGIIEPYIGIDIASTNKSQYSELFAGIGGFDTYNVLTKDFYQDVFKEASFTGKGIYDLEVYDKVISNAFPDNIILSHDLIEGNYLRCGYATDIELLDEFPSSFLVDATRQHRWARGDTQIIGWLKNKVPTKFNKKDKNPETILEKYKIFDNIYRMFLNPSLLLILILSFFTKKPYLWFLLVIFEIALSIIFFLKSKIYKKDSSLKEIYYKHIIYGGKSILARSIIIFELIPFYTKLYLDAFIRTIYRLLFTKKHLLSWKTQELAEKTTSNNLKSYLKAFTVNGVTSLIFIIIFVLTHNYLSLVIAFLFLAAPFTLYKISKEKFHNEIDLNDTEKEEVLDLAKKMWTYFKDNLTEENNYLIPDNYQETRDEKLDTRTSPTAIAYSMSSVISAYYLDFINKDEAFDYLKNILNTIDSLKKWHGNLYNWYDIKTKTNIRPNFISTIDSGNLLACLILTSEFLKREWGDKDAIELTDKLIKNTNLKKLYTKQDVFSIGYDEDEGRLSPYSYNKFASESRLTSYIAIALGEVPSKHWMCLDKSLTTYKGRKGLTSWSGTAFEYFMPYLFQENYSNTLLDETYHFAHFCLKDYTDGIDKHLPWGISESAYNELDDSLNYKYKAFGVPSLKAKEDVNNRIVLSPYSSLMVFSLFKKEVYQNIKKYESLAMTGKYGLYDSYDYDTSSPVKVYYAHHLGMSLMGITNYLKKDKLKELFHSNINIKSFEILLKEKVQLKSSIDIKLSKYKKYNYKRQTIQNDIREYNYISYLPEMSVLSNKKYSLIMNDRGDSFSNFKTLQLNRYRKVTEQDYGIFMYIKDLSNNYTWSNTYAPTNIKPDKYQVVFASDKIKYLRVDGSITTKTEIVVSNSYQAEIRKITITNDSEEDKTLELTTYTEPIICNPMDDISHKVFNNMFISTKYYKSTNTLISKRKSRTSNINSYFAETLLIDKPLEEYSYETERKDFIGRGNNLEHPISIDKELSNYSGDNLDPILSIRNKIQLDKNTSKTVYIISSFGRSTEQIKEIVNHYNNKFIIEKEFKISTLMNAISAKNMMITGDNMRTYNIMLNYLYQTTRLSVTEERMTLLRKNALSKRNLWKFGVSGDLPIILVEIDDIRDISFIKDILKAFEYYKNKSIYIDLIIINSEKESSNKLINKEIDNELYRIYNLNSFYNTPGTVKVIDKATITREEKTLLDIVPRIKFKIENHISLRDAVNNIQKKNKPVKEEREKVEENIELKKDTLELDNGYGGFRHNGEEYVIYNKETPRPWSNVIANEHFGTIVTNNGCGFTYAYNSGEYKITSWTNEMVLNDKSEYFKFDNKLFNPDKCIHGFGYSILSSKTKDYEHSITEFVPVSDTIKIYYIKLKNKLDKNVTSNIEFTINPVLGNFEEKTTRHILTEYIEQDNYLKMRNVYSDNYNDIIVFSSCSNNITSYKANTMLVKSITTSVDLSPNEEKEIVFLLGASKNDFETVDLINKYNKITSVKKALKEVKDYWNNTLGKIQVESKDISFNYMINGWYLYQTISSRIFARSGFYQVSGAYGYRDQLQDATNIVDVREDITKRQILINASHQFIEGDVLHWWHEKTHFGLRSRYKDDFLWLVYATTIYIDKTKDYKILDIKIPYIEGDTLSEYETERGITFNYTEEEETLLEHCIKSLNFSMQNLGPHKLPLMGGGDWNDGMNKVGIKGKGESIWLGFFLYDIINKFTTILSKYKPNINIDNYIEFNEKLKTNLNKKGWDKEYYLRAYFDNGDKLGSIENNECKIDLISQSFAIISGVASKDRVEKCINAVEDNLVDNKDKIIKLLTPPFSKSLDNPGYIMNYPKGIRENGGQYTHSVSWYLIALEKEGYYDRAYRYYQMINPVERTKTKEHTDTYETEPYVVAADIYSSEHFASRGGWTWYTGTAAWFYRVGIEYILGIKKEGEKLKLEPNIPVSWDGFKLTYKYKNTTYNIEVVKGKKQSLKVDNRNQISSYIKLVDDNIPHNIKLTIIK